MGKGESVDKCDGKRRSFSSTVNILVTNNTGEVLSAKQEWVKGGEAFNHPSDIMPGDQEAFLVVRNHAGNHGTLSYSLGTARLLLNVMWTSGMNCDHYANTVGVGVTSSPNTDKFNTMFFERQPWFKKQNFMFSPDPLVLRADRFLITAVMVIKPQTDIFITVEDLEEK